MTLHRAMWSTLVIAILSLAAQSGSGQEVLRSGPPPEIRALLDGFVQAVNSGVDGLETFAQAHFSPTLLQKQTREQRAERHRQLINDFGTITLDRVTREGPNAPLQLTLKGSNESGVVILDLDAGSPPRIAAMRVKLGGSPQGEPANGDLVHPEGGISAERTDQEQAEGGIDVDGVKHPVPAGYGGVSGRCLRCCESGCGQRPGS